MKLPGLLTISIVMCVAREDPPFETLDVDDEDSARREDQVLDMDMPAHPVRDQHVLQGLDRDALERSLQLGLAPAPPGEREAAEQREDGDSEQDPILDWHLRFILYLSVFYVFIRQSHCAKAVVNASSLGSRDQHRAGRSSRASSDGGTATARPMIGSTIVSNFAGCAVAQTSQG